MTPEPHVPELDDRITFPEELPVSQLRHEIALALHEHQVLILAGETGSGKTTQLPKIALALGRTSIGHTQPRRIAARSIAERVADELGSQVGQTVGYQVRFTDKVSAQTKIKLMTDGVLLNELHRDRLLTGYDTIIIDEAHERSLNIDFLLGYLKTLLPKRPDLKLVITSATIEVERFSRHFGDAPIITVEGRTYPVEVRYRPLVAETTDVSDGGTSVSVPKENNDPKDLFDAIIDALVELSREGPGDVLVFLSGENEIRDVAEAITGKARSGPLLGTEVLPLYGRLSAAEQHRVFAPVSAPGIRRRVILATNVAETSLTVPGIKYVIDVGTARISRYSTRAKVQRLPIEAISQASANQRSGRAGRTSDGIAIRLYSEQDYLKRKEYTEPEIVRTNLAAVILQMLALGLGDIAQFPFVDPPDSRGIKDGLDLLTELGAVRSGKLTKVGRDLARLPIEPRFGRMVVESRKHGVAREVLIIVAGLTIQDVRERPQEKRAQADQLHARFADPTSDFLSLLNLWNYVEGKQQELGSSAFRRLCRNEHLNFLRVREWMDVYRQLRQLAKPLQLELNPATVNPDGIHRSLLAGLLSHIGVRDRRSEQRTQHSGKQASTAQSRRVQPNYIGARQAKFVLFPGSSLVKKAPDVVMCGELVETSRLFARTNAAIDPAWAESIAPELVKRTVGEPRWEKKQGAAVAYERVTLFGVPIVERRRVQLARFDRAQARHLFIQHALVEGEWEERHAFDRDNRRLLAKLAQVEERSRRRDILLDGEVVFAFYDARIPTDVVSASTFDRWWRAERSRNPDLLQMRKDDLLAEDEPKVDESLYPRSWRSGEQELRLKYRFDPGAEDDGVTVAVPLPLLPSIEQEQFDALVPGLRQELVVALIKSLPKTIRRNVVPAADWARRLLATIERGPDTRGGAFVARVASEITAATGVPVAATDFEVERIPAHLRPNFAVLDENGRSLAVSKDLTELRQQFAGRARSTVAQQVSKVSHSIERDGVVSWDFGDMPRIIETRHGKSVVKGYPALADKGDSVSIAVFALEREQSAAMRLGVGRLVALSTPSPVSYLKEHLSSGEKLVLATSPYRSVAALFDDLLLAVADSQVLEFYPGAGVWQQGDFARVSGAFADGLIDRMFPFVTLTAQVLDGVRKANRAIDQANDLRLLPSLTEAKAHLESLVFDGFLSATGLTQLSRLPIYLQAVAQRMAKLPQNPSRDLAAMADLQKATAAYSAVGGDIPLRRGAAPHIAELRWMLEEFRVSLFAEQLRTPYPISVTRILKRAAEAN